jgi:hypothetical protein
MMTLPPHVEQWLERERDGALRCAEQLLTRAGRRGLTTSELLAVDGYVRDAAEIEERRARLRGSR